MTYEEKDLAKEKAAEDYAKPEIHSKQKGKKREPRSSRERKENGTRQGKTCLQRSREEIEKKKAKSKEENATEDPEDKAIRLEKRGEQYHAKKNRALVDALRDAEQLATLEDSLRNLDEEINFAPATQATVGLEQTQSTLSACDGCVFTKYFCEDCRRINDSTVKLCRCASNHKSMGWKQRESKEGDAEDLEYVCPDQPHSREQLVKDYKGSCGRCKRKHEASGAESFAKSKNRELAGRDVAADGSDIFVPSAVRIKLESKSIFAKLVKTMLLETKMRKNTGKASPRLE
jgi:hypothetical protein